MMMKTQAEESGPSSTSISNTSSRLESVTAESGPVKKQCQQQNHWENRDRAEKSGLERNSASSRESGPSRRFGTSKTVPAAETGESAAGEEELGP